MRTKFYKTLIKLGKKTFQMGYFHKHKQLNLWKLKILNKIDKIHTVYCKSFSKKKRIRFNLKKMKSFKKYKFF